MSFVMDDLDCTVWRCLCRDGGYRKVNPIADLFFPPSKLLTIDYSPATFWKAGFIPLVMHSGCFFLKTHEHAHSECAHRLTNTHTRTQAPDLVFLLSRRSMNKTGVQRLSEKQWETRGVLADLAAAVAVCSCHNLRVWTYRISSLLDVVCSENTHSFANVSVQTRTHV